MHYLTVRMDKYIYPETLINIHDSFQWPALIVFDEKELVLSAFIKFRF